MVQGRGRNQEQGISEMRLRFWSMSIRQDNVLKAENVLIYFLES